MDAVFAVKSTVRGRVQLGQAEDLGPGGMTLRRLPEFPAPPGSAITLTFALPEGTPAAPLLKVTGVVVSDALAGTFRRTGVRFAGLSDEATQRIAQFCEAESERFYPAAGAALSSA